MTEIEAKKTTNAELLRRERLHEQAVILTSRLHCRCLAEPLHSNRLDKIKAATQRASARAERRYQASRAAYRAMQSHW